MAEIALAAFGRRGTIELTVDFAVVAPPHKIPTNLVTWRHRLAERLEQSTPNDGHLGQPTTHTLFGLFQLPIFVSVGAKMKPHAADHH